MKLSLTLDSHPSIFILWKNDLDLIYEIKYSVNPKKRQFWTDEENSAFREILDEVMPFLSGREWRMREWTREDTWRFF